MAEFKSMTHVDDIPFEEGIMVEINGKQIRSLILNTAFLPLITPVPTPEDP
jgi:hypothetical protein